MNEGVAVYWPMGYDHFALLATVEAPSEEDCKLLKEACEKVRKGQKIEDGPLFGAVHHLGCSVYNEWWLELFNEFVFSLYEACPRVKGVYVYACCYDGWELTQYEFFEGAPKGEPEKITASSSDPRVRPLWSLKGLIVKNNFTAYYNSKGYYWDCNFDD